jgi:hypothetical protein
MKINKDFAVIINGERFEAFDILEIHIDGGKFKMICEHGKEAKKILECRTRDVEFVSVPQIPILAQGGVVIGRDRTHTYREYCKVGDEPASDIEIVSPPVKSKKAFDEVDKGIDKTAGAIPSPWGYYMCGDRGFYGPPFGSSADDIEICAPLGTMKKVVEDALKEVKKAEWSIRYDITVDGEKLGNLVKKYNHTGGD